MGCVSSKAFESESAPVTANPTAQFLNRNVGRESNRNLMEKRSKSEKSNYQREVKLLLLGTGESGKSTILKQMRLHHKGGYTPEERDSYREIVYANLIQSMQVVIEALHDLKMVVPPNLANASNHIMNIRVSAHDPAAPMLDNNTTQALSVLWADEQTKACVMKSREFQLNDSASYYFDAAARIGSQDYVPTDQDILRSRVKTTGLTEERFEVGQLRYVVFDVGGQRSERKKWIHCFEKVFALIFLVAISEYDQTLYEDSDINRMNEAAGLFESISNSRWFANSSVILFLNKTDLFKLKLISSPIYEFYSDYEGPSDYRTAISYMESKFRPLYRNGDKHPLICHQTCATDSDQLKLVFEAVEESILIASLADSRLFQTITRSTASSSTTTVNSLDTASITSTSSFLPSSSADYNPLYSPMGCAQSSSADDKISGEQNRLIEEGLKKDKVQARSEAKMLLLGAGESGKSTILKQMRLAYREPFTVSERTSYREVVFSNLVQSMQAVISALPTLNLVVPQDLEQYAEFIIDLEDELEPSSMLDKEITRSIFLLWSSPIFKSAVEQAFKFQLNDSAQYFFEEIKRIGAADFLPNDQDILRTRVRSTGIIEERFRIKGYLLRVFDVGGQRSERKKWIHCFEAVSVLIFVVAISEYDQNLYEDESVNRLTEATQLFESLVSSKWFSLTSFVLLLNKIDLFRKKIITAPLEDYYPDYLGGQDLNLATSFMVKRFTRLYPAKGRRQLYTHATCATDSAQVRVVISAMLDSVISATLTEVGLM